MVVVVARKDLWKKRVQSNVAFLNGSTGRNYQQTIQKRKFASIIIKLFPFILILWNFGYVKVSRFSNYRNI
jgi:hypothetical protein